MKIKLTDKQVEKLLLEQTIGQDHKETYERLIEPFFAERKALLFSVFCDTSADDVEQLQLIKMQETVLESMRKHFMHFIETGKMAEIQLANDKQEDEE